MVIVPVIRSLPRFARMTRMTRKRRFAHACLGSRINNTGILHRLNGGLKTRILWLPSESVRQLQQLLLLLLQQLQQQLLLPINSQQQQIARSYGGSPGAPRRTQLGNRRPRRTWPSHGARLRRGRLVHQVARPHQEHGGVPQHVEGAFLWMFPGTRLAS